MKDCRAVSGVCGAAGAADAVVICDPAQPARLPMQTTTATIGASRIRG